MALLTGCGTQKNTARGRWWHAFHTRYNTYYNGAQAYIDGSLEKEQGNKDNYTELIPLYTVANKQSKDLGKSNFERAIEKSQKAIQRHSIRKRPVWNKSRRKTAKDIEWLNRREYNPFIWKAWMLMGRSQFHEGDFEGAASTFAYMGRLFETQPAIYGRARAWLAKCYVEQDWLYDAEDVIRNMERDSIHWRAQKEWDYTYADYYIHAGQYEKAVPYLRKVIKHEMRRKQRAREWYLLGQILSAIGQKTEAYEAFRHVVRLNPPYELEFNARISMSEVMAVSDSKRQIGKLKRMAASDKNKEYQDQIYYALGNIYLLQRDTVNAISAYEKGNTKSTRNGIEKGVLLLHLGDIYWQQEKYSDARRCYSAAIGLLDKERKDYKQLSERSKVLDELVPYTDAVHLQDSLQQLARMDEKDRNAAIDRVIEQLKKKEKEERNRQAEEDAQKQMAKNGGNANSSSSGNKNATGQNNITSSSSSSSTWYFYNPMAVSQGKTSFQRLWGKRENVDNWQRINKTVVANPQGAEEMTDEQRDSLAQASEREDSVKQMADNAQNDPHKREYYLAQIPFTEQQLAESNKTLTDGLYHSGVIFKDKLDNLPLSEKALRRIEDHYPSFEHMDDVYYHLYLLYMRKGQTATADSYISKLKKDYAESQWTTLLTDPYYADNAKFGVHIEDSLYASAYDAFREGHYAVVKTNAEISEKRFPTGANRQKFIFIAGLGKLNEGDADGCVADMKTIVEKYPEGRISEMAGMIVNGVNAGKRLKGGRFDLENVWSRRTTVLNDKEKEDEKTFSPERNTPFVFLFAYKPDSVNENQLLFEMAKFNFTTYLVRNFDLEIVDQDGLHLMQITGFRNYDEAMVYAHNLLAQQQITRLLGKSRTLVISTENLELLGKRFSYDEYAQYYSKHFAPLKKIDQSLLTEPTEITTDKEPESSSDEEINAELEEENGASTTTTTVVPVEEEKPASEVPATNVIPVEEEKPELEVPATNVIPVEEEKRVAETPTTNVIPVEEEKTEVKPSQTTIVPAEEPQAAKKEETPIMQTETPVKSQVVPEKQQTTPEKQQATPAKQPTVAEEKQTVPVKPQPAPAKKQPEPKIEEQQDDDFSSNTTVIYEEDATQKENTTNGNQKKKNNKKKEKEETYDLDDEYFDLDGF